MNDGKGLDRLKRASMTEELVHIEIGTIVAEVTTELSNLNMRPQIVLADLRSLRVVLASAVEIRGEELVTLPNQVVDVLTSHEDLPVSWDLVVDVMIDVCVIAACGRSVP